MPAAQTKLCHVSSYCVGWRGAGGPRSGATNAVALAGTCSMGHYIRDGQRGHRSTACQCCRHYTSAHSLMGRCTIQTSSARCEKLTGALSRGRRQQQQLDVTLHLRIWQQNRKTCTGGLKTIASLNCTDYLGTTLILRATSISTCLRSFSGSKEAVQTTAPLG